MLTALSGISSQVETLLTGPLPINIKRNMRIELWSALAYGIFYATTLPFIPVLLRRMGATPNMLAIYTSQQFLGSLLTAFSIVLMRRRRTKSVIVTSWLVGRSLLLLFALITRPEWVLVLSACFWLLEAFPNPGYMRILQKLYPNEVRGKVMSFVRVGRITTVVLVTPLAGWALDHLGYQYLFPLGSLLGIGAALIFIRLDLDEGPLPPRQTKTFTELGEILRRDRRFAYYLLCFVFYGSGTLLSWTLYPLVQVDRLHLSYSELGLLGLAQSLFWLLGYLYWGRQVDRKGGLWVLRLNCAIAALVPFSYIWAGNAWMLLPAFITQGIINAGWDMGLITSGIQLAKAEKVTEYAAIQTTVVGLRGMVVPMISVVLLNGGLSLNTIFGISIGCMVIAWVMFGRVDAPLPALPPSEARYQWPIRFRWPKQ
ncbi:MAG: MFS transporter [Caldilineaceae bacterium]